MTQNYYIPVGYLGGFGAIISFPNKRGMISFSFQVSVYTVNTGIQAPILEPFNAPRFHITVGHLSRWIIPTKIEL